MTLAVVATLSASCGFLEVEQVGKSDIDTYFSEVSALQPALNGCYHLLYSFYDRRNSSPMSVTFVLRCSATPRTAARPARRWTTTMSV